MANANIVDHIGGKVTVWTKDGNAAENRTLHTVDDFGVVISNQHGKQTFIPWGQVKYIDYPQETGPAMVIGKPLSVDELNMLKGTEPLKITPLEVASTPESPKWFWEVFETLTTKFLSEELSKRTGVQTYQLSPGELMSMEQGGGIRILSGPAIVLFNQD
ncbi:BC1881 family protein [Paenibacillus maysiensis]|uniref:BC1881 family protein n=1 Tax=Paenibacillus maysiensis TaxID=1155954 RepID=UPI0004708690|nr:BC1881 family protein [Paenibacillus maysiensis]